MKMTIIKWLEGFDPIRNPGKPQSDSAYGFRGFIFGIGCFCSFDPETHDPHANNKIWSLIKEDEKIFLVNGFHPENAEGFFMTRIECNKNYRITKLM
jgi:hypothetical protein